MVLIKKIESSSLLQLATFTLIGFLFYWPSLLGGPTFIDDDGFIFEFIPLIKSQNPLLFWDYSGEYARSWPLSYTVFWAIYKLVQDTYWVYKLINLCLHIFNAYLIVDLFKDDFPKKSLIIAAIVYLIHPIQVETVSWIFQLNTIMATSFFLLSYKAFLNFLKKKSVTLYASAIYLFLFSLLSKVSAIMLPFLFLYQALRKYPSKKTFALFLTMPFFILSLYKGLEGTDALEGLKIDKRLVIDRSEEKEEQSPPPPIIDKPQETKIIDKPQETKIIEKKPTVVTVTKDIETKSSPKKEKVEPVIQEEQLPSESSGAVEVEIIQEGRFENVLKKMRISYASFSYYLSHFLLPVELSIIMPDITQKNLKNILSWIFTAILLITSFLKIKKINEPLYSTILFLILSVIPILGFVFIPFMNLSLVADHWFYLGMIPTSLLFVSLVRKLRSKHKTLFIYIFLAFWSFRTLTYVHLFNDKFQLIERAIEMKPDEFSLRMELATALLEDNKLREAQDVIEEALSQPNFKDNILLLMQGGYIDRQLGDTEKLSRKIYQIGMIYIEREEIQNAKVMLKQLKEVSNDVRLIQSLKSYLERKEN